MVLQTTKEFPVAKYLQGTELLSYDELGVYIRLLDHMWISRGKILDNDEKIAHYLRLKIKKWQNYKKVLQSFFVFSKSRISHPMIVTEHEKLAKKSRQNSLNAKKRWRIKAENLQDKTSSAVQSN